MFIQKLKSTTAVLGVVMVLGACASQDTRIRLQQPPQPTGQAMLVPIRHPLRNAVVIDYVSGMSQHSYFFAEANQNAYRPLLQQALDKSGMAARTPLAGRYGLQVEFEDLRYRTGIVCLRSCRPQDSNSKGLPAFKAGR